MGSVGTHLLLHLHRQHAMPMPRICWPTALDYMSSSSRAAPLSSTAGRLQLFHPRHARGLSALCPVLLRTYMLHMPQVLAVEGPQDQIPEQWGRGATGAAGARLWRQLVSSVGKRFFKGEGWCGWQGVCCGQAVGEAAEGSQHKQQSVGRQVHSMREEGWWVVGGPRPFSQACADAAEGAAQAVVHSTREEELGGGGVMRAAGIFWPDMWRCSRRSSASSRAGGLGGNW